MELVVREAVAADADDIAHAHVEGWRTGYRGQVPDEFLDSDAFAAFRRDGWRAILTGRLPDVHRPDDSIFVAADQGRAVGFGHIGRERGDHDRGELLGFYVHPDYWGTGAAQQLIERCHIGLAELADEWLLWVLRDNPRARAFYERNGWSPGSGDEVVHAEWDGPVMDGAPKLDTPLPEVQYRRSRQGVSTSSVL